MDKFWNEIRRKLWDEDRMSEEEVEDLVSQCYYQHFDITYDLDYNSR